MDWFTAKVTWWWKAEGINSLASGIINSLWMLQSYCDLGIYWTKTGNGGYQWGNNAEVCTIIISSVPYSYMHCAEMLPEDNQAQTSVSHLHFLVCVTEQLCAEEYFVILEKIIFFVLLLRDQCLAKLIQLANAVWCYMFIVHGWCIFWLWVI